MCGVKGKRSPINYSGELVQFAQATLIFFPRGHFLFLKYLAHPSSFSPGFLIPVIIEGILLASKIFWGIKHAIQIFFDLVQNLIRNTIMSINRMADRLALC